MKGMNLAALHQRRYDNLQTKSSCWFVLVRGKNSSSSVRGKYLIFTRY